MKRSAAILLCGLMLQGGCSDDAQVQTSLAQLEARVQALETRPQLDFVLTDFQTSINEKMFAPLLHASATLQAEGERMPQTFYVDVMMRVKVPHLQHDAVERQIFPVVNGQALLRMHQSLPQHGLKPEQVEVTLRPMTWYRSQVISDDMISYQ